MELQPFGLVVCLGMFAEVAVGLVLLVLAVTRVRAAHPRAAGLLAAAAAMHLIAVSLGCLYVWRPFPRDDDSHLVILDALAITHPITRALSLALVAAAVVLWLRDRGKSVT